MKTMPDGEGLEASPKQLESYRTDTADPCPRCPRAACRPRRIQVLLRICLCCCAVTSSLLLSSLQSSTRREWKPALLRIDKMHFLCQASCAWVFVLLVGYQPRSVCWTAGRCWPGTTGYKRVWTPPGVLLQDGLRFVLAAAALRTPQAAGQSPQLTAEHLQKPGKLHGTRLFAAGLGARGRRLFEHVTQHPPVCEGNKEACINSSRRPRLSLASHASHGTAARGERRQRHFEVRRSRSEMVSGHLRLKAASSLPGSSAPPAETGKPNKPSSGAGRSRKRAAAATGAANRVLEAVVTPAQNQEQWRVLSSSIAAQSIEDQRAKPTIEQGGTGAAAGPAQVDTAEAVDARSAPAVGDQLEREGVHQSFSKGKARDDERVRTLGVLENNALHAWQHSTRFPHGAPPDLMSFPQPPSTGPEDLTDHLLYADDPSDGAHSAKPDTPHQRDRRAAGSLGSFASSVSRPFGGRKERPAGITEPHLTVAVAEKERRRHPRGGSERGEHTADADDSTSYHAAAEAPQRNARRVEIKPDTTPGLSQPSEHEQLVIPSRSPGNSYYYYRVEDTPKIYGDSGHTVGAPVVWEKPAVSNVGRGRPRKERWVPEDVQNDGVDAQDTQGRRESVAKNDLLDEVDWADPESLSRAESFLRQQMRGLERQVSILEDQLKGIEADMEVYRAGIEGVNPDQNADTFEKLVYGGQSSSHQVLLEKLQTASQSLDSRVKMYVRTNTTFYANQLNDIVQVRLAPLRQGVLDLSLSLMDAATSTIDITRQLHEAADHVNATTAREAAQMEALRARREAAFTEALEEEEIAMQAQLVASKHREQSRVNKSSVEEQILLSAIEGAVVDMDKRGFAVLDFSAVYPESEARKVLDLTLYFAHLQTRAHRWEVLPIVVVPSSAFLGHIKMPQTASEWLTSVLASADGAFSSSTSNQSASIVAHGGASSATRTGGRKKRRGGNPTLPPLSTPRRTSNRIIEYDTITTDESGGSPGFDTAFAGEAATKGSNTQDHYRDFSISRRTSLYKWDARSGWTVAAGLNEHPEDRNKLTSRAQSATRRTGQVDTNNSGAGILGQDDAAEGQPRQLSQSDILPTRAEGSSAAARAAAAAKQLKTAHEGNDAQRVRQAYTPGTMRRLGGLEVDSPVDLAGIGLPRAAASAAEKAFSGGVAYGKECDIKHCSPDLQRIRPRRLSVLNRVWSGRFNRAVGLGRIRRELRNKTVGFGSKERAAQAGPAQLFYAPQFILGETYSGVDQVETGRKWQASVLRKTQAVVASWWGGPGYMGADYSESREIRSILPPTFTLQHLVREHFEQSHAKPEKTGFSPREEGPRFTAGDAAHHQEENSAGSGAAGAPSSRASAGTSGLTSQPTAPQSHRKNGLEQFESRLGYYVLRAEKILLEGFYVAPSGEVSSVLLRYPHLRDLGSLVPAGQYGVQLLRQLVTSLHANAEMRRRCPHRTAAAAFPATSQLPADKHPPTNGRAASLEDRAGQARASPSQAKAASGAQPVRRAPKKKDEAPEDGPGCTPASYNPFLLCLVSPRLSTSAHGGPSSVTGASGTDYDADGGRDSSAPRIGEQYRSHRGVSRGPGPGRSDARHPHDQTVMHKTAAGRAAGCNADESVDAPVSPAQCASQLPRGKTALNHGDEVEEELLLKRKVLIIHLGPRSDGLPLAYPDGAGGKELHRQRLVRHSLTELLASSASTDSCVEDCGSCLAEAGGTRTPPSQGQKPAERKDAASTRDTGTGDGSERAPETPLRRSGVWGAGVEAEVLKPRDATGWPARFGLLRAGGAVDPSTVTLAKALKDMKLESAVRKQLLALEQELRLASPTRWAVEGAVVEKHLENYQVEILVAWGRPPPALHLPLTPFFTHNVLLIRVEVEKCPKKYGDNSYSVPPNSVLEHALYLLAHPVAGLAALAAFHYGKNSGKPFLERLRKGHEHWDVTPSGLAMHAANFWGRATGASMHTFWIAHVRVKAPGHTGGSSIELLDGRLHGEAGSFVPLSDSQKSDRRILFPGEAEAWGWRYADSLTPEEGPFLQGRLAGYGDAATTCKAVEALVQSTAANLQTRVIPQKFVSGLRGRSVILAFSSTEVPFKGEQLVSLAGRETGRSAEASPKKTALL